MHADSNATATLKSLRGELLTLHRELIASERIVFERSAGAIPSAAAFLQLLAHDPWFEWMRPLSKLIAEIDAAIADKKQPVTGEIAKRLVDETRTLLSPDEQGDGFGKNYFEVMQRDPHMAVAHAELARLLKSLQAA